MQYNDLETESHNASLVFHDLNEVYLGETDLCLEIKN